MIDYEAALGYLVQPHCTIKYIFELLNNYKPWKNNALYALKSISRHFYEYSKTVSKVYHFIRLFKSLFLTGGNLTEKST